MPAFSPHSIATCAMKTIASILFRCLQQVFRNTCIFKQNRAGHSTYLPSLRFLDFGSPDACLPLLLVDGAGGATAAALAAAALAAAVLAAAAFGFWIFTDLTTSKQHQTAFNGISPLHSRRQNDIGAQKICICILHKPGARHDVVDTDIHLRAIDEYGAQIVSIFLLQVR